MVAITPGSSGTFVSSTAEARLLEAVCFLQLQEADTTKNPTGRNGVSGSFDLENKTFSGTYSFPVGMAIASNGSVQLTATPYLSAVTFSPGTGSPTFVSTTPEAYLLEVLTFLQAKEANSTSNPNGLNYVTGSYNADSGLYQGGFSLPCSFALGTGGKLEITASPYLA